MTRSRALFAMPILALVAGILSVLTMAPAQAFDRDCGDFPNQAAAQKFFETTFKSFNEEAADLLLQAGVIKKKPDLTTLADPSFIK